MKKFTEETFTEKEYSESQKNLNKINDTITESLKPTIDGESNNDLVFIGKRELVSEIYKIIENKVIDMKIEILNGIKNKKI